MQNSLVDAINDRTVLHVSYDGDARIIEPYTYGINTKGNEAVRVYQISGISSSGQTEGWKLLLIDKLTIVENTSETFSVRSDYKTGDKGFSRIYAEVEL